MPKNLADELAQTYRIGAVSRLTGIPSETLRVWERRYGVVTPSRAGGRFRLYTRDDVSRLAMLKQLVDSGHAIGSIAPLNLDQLQERLETDVRRGTLAKPEAEARPCRMAVLGDAITARLRRAKGEMSGVEIEILTNDHQEFERSVRESQPDVIVMEYSVVNAQTPKAVHALLRSAGAARAIVVYGFGRQEVVRSLDTAQVEPMRAPVDLAELRRACIETMRVSWREKGPGTGVLAKGPIPPPRYTSEALAQIAGASTTIVCECPRHLVDLINGLLAFEHYSAECESRSREDAALHVHLHVTTAQARAMLEEALSKIIEAERKEVPPVER